MSADNIFELMADLYSDSWVWAVVLWLIVLTGTVKILSVLHRFVQFQCKHRCRKLNKDMFKKYGDATTNRTYALVTGGSDGIGLAYCKELASQGFQLIIVGRNEEKIQQRFKEIRKELDLQESETDWKCIKADFGNLSKIEDYDYIYDACKHLDIGMLIINAGWGTPFLSHATPKKWVDDQVIMNVSQTPFMVRKFLPLMKARHQKRGAIILVSSASAFLENSYFGLYMASKSYLLKYACCLYHELKQDGIDVLAYCPSFVDTPLVADSKLKYKLGCISAERAADVTFRDLGIEPYTVGDIVHEKFLWKVSFVPRSMLNKDAKRQKDKFESNYEAMREYEEEQKTMAVNSSFQQA